jgi:hypothetical protein
LHSQKSPPNAARITELLLAAGADVEAEAMYMVEAAPRWDSSRQVRRRAKPESRSP